MSLHEKVHKILLVDDDIDLLEQHKILLETKGHKIVTAENVEDGWNVFKKRNLMQQLLI